MQSVIFKVEQIGSGFFAVMAHSVSRGWIDYEFVGIAKYGIHQVVSLLEKSESFDLGLQDEKALCEQNAMGFLSFPIEDHDFPVSITQYKKLIRNLYHDIAGGKNTVIHCRAGIGRTGIVAAGILFHCGFEPKQALQLISNKRGVQVPDTDQQREWLIENYKLIVNDL